MSKPTGADFKPDWANRLARGDGVEARALHRLARALLLHRIARLQRTRQLFQLWHVFHRPLVWVMFTIFLVQILFRVKVCIPATGKCEPVRLPHVAVKTFG